MFSTTNIQTEEGGISSFCTRTSMGTYVYTPLNLNCKGLNQDYMLLFCFLFFSFTHFFRSIHDQGFQLNSSHPGLQTICLMQTNCMITEPTTPSNFCQSEDSSVHSAASSKD